MRVASLHSYPIKGCYRCDHRELAVEPWGPAGDRRWVLIDADGAMVTQRQVPDLVRIKPRADGATLLSIPWNRGQFRYAALRI